ncbi:MAG: glycerophosphodiester phosphodiesterase [Caulobacteraceae bacterium]|nr:glycerophosphodiester phosphodiesterase [Caulobacteraceae bacterium]
MIRRQVLMMGAAMAAGGGTARPRPIVIAHRGASGERPEHTLAAYRLAIAQGADFIEPDLVATRDGVLVARHENEISQTTDVADHAEFAGRRTEKTIDGQTVSGWFTEDFTLAELKRLRARERLPQLRPGNVRYDGRESIPTFQEVIDLARREGAQRGRAVGLYPELKHPAHFRSRDLALEPRLLEALARNRLDRREASVFVQCFEVAPLQALREQTPVRLVQLIAADQGPADRPQARPAQMTSPEGLAAIAGYADGIGVEKALLASGRLVADAHRAGLVVHAWTYRAENAFLPPALRRGEAAGDHGDLAAELRAAFALGLDGVFSDFPGAAVAARDGAG